MQIARAGQSNPVTADLNDGTDAITSGVVTHYLKALSGTNARKWWKASDGTWSGTEVAAGTGTHDGRGHWVCDVAAAAWLAGVRYETYAVHADDGQINYRSEVLCLTSGGIWPAAETDWPVSLAELKAHLRIDADDDEENALLSGYLGAATRWAEQYNGRRFLTTTCVDIFDAFDYVIYPERKPLSSIDSIVYIDPDGNEQTLDAAAYHMSVIRDIGRIAPAYGYAWPETQSILGAVTVTYQAGFGADGDDVPQIYRNAILMIAGSLYESREETSPIVIHNVPFGARQLLGIDRLVTV